MSAFLRRLLPAVVLWACVVGVEAAVREDAVREWPVPVAGNAYRARPDPFFRSDRRADTIAWSDPAEVYSIYFHVDRACAVRLAVEARAPGGAATLQVSVNGRTFETAIDGADFATHEIGVVDVTEPGYVRVDLQGKEKHGETFGEVRNLIVRSSTEDLTLTRVASNEGGMFYWGRRGPSVHLGYALPAGIDFEYGYSEIVVADGDDPIGSYFMANGFAEGYFGIQVNGADERRVLFSVWSPFQTDNPADIPPDQRVELLAKGPDVRTGEFGNEGSGGQSFLVYPWKTGRPYRFLTRVAPNGDGSTTYTSWFGDKQADEWRLIASFRRPKTDTTLKRFHSFLENFDPRTGHLGRRGDHRNVWARDVGGQWHELLTARFTVDATGGKGHRRDFTGGADGTAFCLRNCGFFTGAQPPGTVFTRASSAADRPAIDFGKLPQN
jgi:hypothetical protein